MSTFDAPAISVGTKTNEQNMQTVKAYLVNLSSELNYQFGVLNSEIEALKKEISSMKGDE